MHSTVPVTSQTLLELCWSKIPTWEKHILTAGPDLMQYDFSTYAAQPHAVRDNDRQLHRGLKGEIPEIKK